MNAGSSAPGAKGLVVAAPASGSGKTTLVAGLLRLLMRRGLGVSALKLGPDYIDPAFHAAASGRLCLSIDLWAMRPETVAGLLAGLSQSGIVVAEAAMGLFDGAADGTGSAADFAALTGWPVVLAVDARGQAQSAGALLAGFARHRADVPIAGVVFNRVGAASHEAMLRAAAQLVGIPVLGCLPRAADLILPGRHLGLNTSGAIVRTNDDHLVVTLGLKDVIVVHTRNATLVADKHSEEQIRHVVKKLEELGWSEYL